jgi:hypothetical protein
MLIDARNYMPKYATPNFVLPISIETDVRKPLASCSLGPQYRVLLEAQEIMLCVPT